MSVPLPNCYKNWPDIQLRLNNLRDHPNWANLERVILDFCNQTKKVAGSWETPETTTFPDEFDPTIAIRELPNLKKIAETTKGFYSEFIPRLVELSLELSSLFPNSKLCVLKGKSEDRLELTRKQVNLFQRILVQSCWELILNFYIFRLLAFWLICSLVFFNPCQNQQILKAIWLENPAPQDH